MELQQQKQRDEQFWRVMDDTELSLAPSQVVATQSKNCSSSESEAYSPKKRKYYWDHLKTDPSLIKTSIELQLKDPLPIDWEQCLDLESGRMYYLNRKTLKISSNCPKEQKLDLELNRRTLKISSNCPKEQKLDLELNMSTLTSSDGRNSSSEMLVGSKKHTSLNSNNMFAVACLKCHLLVMLCKSSPSCPNCKYVNPLPNQQSPHPETFTTLSLLK